MVLYRKYRPQKISELDNQEVRERLARVFSSPFLPHAFLFSGPKGTGKTSAARIVAKVLNCEKRIKQNEGVILGRSKATTPESRLDSGQARMTKAVEPCNSCESCKAITEGRFLDVLEIDAASNRGIEEIRELREKIKLAPISANYKVYIIDEVHMLTNEAFNALLKTLEEPPQHAVFILATTLPEKLPETITSRCTRFNFQKATIDEVLHCLTRVVKGENLTLADEVFKLIAVSSEGSFRDATKILEQAILEEALQVEKLKVILGRQHISAEHFLKILVSQNTKDVLSEIAKMSQNGANFRFLTEEILHFLHDLLLSKYGIEKEKMSQELRDAFSIEEVNSLIKLFSRVYIELKSASLPQLPLEVAVVEWCEQKNNPITQ